MFVDINELRERKEPLLIVKDFSEEELKIDNPISALPYPAHSEVQVSLRGERVCVEGKLGADLVLTCARCAKPFARKIQKDFELEYRPDPVVEAEGEDLGLAYTDLEIGFYRDDRLDVRAVISEQIVLEIPMKPICKEACKGLCDQCGADLNGSPCDCQPESVDPRFEALIEVKRRMGE